MIQPVLTLQSLPDWCPVEGPSVAAPAYQVTLLTSLGNRRYTSVPTASNINKDLSSNKGNKIYRSHLD